MSVAYALIRKHVRHTANLNRIIKTQSRFKWAFVSAFAGVFEGGLFLLFVYGLRFLKTFGGIGTLIVNRLFSLFFLGMAVMLVVSSLVTAYSTIYRSAEIPFLLTRPFTVSQIVVYKFYESALLSSWAFFFIVIPFIAAYGWCEKLSPLLALWTFLFAVPFLVFCAGVGTLFVMAVVRWVPRVRAVRVGALVLGFALLGAVWLWAQQVAGSQNLQRFNIAQFVPGLVVASNVLIPSTWVSEGIMALTSGQWSRGFLFLSLLMSSAALMTMFVEWLGSATFYSAWQRVAAGQGRSSRRTVLFPSLNRVLRFLGADVRAMVMKDLRTFLRDPMQWSQALVFFGMLALYFSNLRNFNYNDLDAAWRNLIAFLNVFGVSAVVCSFGSRFVYPQLSLEGHGFWVVGLSPMTMRRVLLTKFLSSVLGLGLISVLLTLMSCAMLQLALPMRLAAVTVVSAVSVAACGLSTGLGGVFLDLHQKNPAAIVSGFGGTLNLVLSLTFMLASIVPFWVLFHLDAVGYMARPSFQRALVVAFAWLFLVTGFTVWLPIRLALRSLAKRDF